MKILLEHKANPNLTDKFGKAPLMYALDLNSVEMVEALLNKKADPNFQHNRVKQRL